MIPESSVTEGTVSFDKVASESHNNWFSLVDTFKKKKKNFWDCLKTAGKLR